MPFECLLVAALDVVGECPTWSPPPRPRSAPRRRRSFNPTSSTPGVVSCCARDCSTCTRRCSTLGWPRPHFRRRCQLARRYDGLARRRAADGVDTRWHRASAWWHATKASLRLAKVNRNCCRRRRRMCTPRSSRQANPNFDYAQALYQIAIVLGSVSIVATSRRLL